MPLVHRVPGEAHGHQRRCLRCLSRVLGPRVAVPADMARQSAYTLLLSMVSLPPRQAVHPKHQCLCIWGRPPMSTNATPPEEALRDALAVATTWEQFGKALQRFRRTRPWLSLRKMEHRPGCLSRSAISARETGKCPFAEQELRDYLQACKAAPGLIEDCIKHHRRIAQSPPQISPQVPSSSSVSTTGVVHAVSVASLTLKIPDPQAEINRLRNKAYSYGQSGEFQRAVDATSEAVIICENIYGLDHPVTLDARTQQLWFTSKVFTEGCCPYIFRSRRLRERQEKNAADLRLSWETLIGSFQQAYGPGHSKTLQVRWWYAECIRETCFIKSGLGSRKLFRGIIVDVIAEASHSLGRQHEFTLKMRWELTASEGGWRAWSELAYEFANELGYWHPMTVEARRKGWLGDTYRDPSP